MEPAKSPKGLRKLIARPLKRGASTKAAPPKATISPISINFNPAPREERTQKHKTKSNGALLKLLKKTIPCVSTTSCNTMENFEEDRVAECMDVMEISPRFIERAQSSASESSEDALVVETPARTDTLTEIAKVEVSIALERNLAFDGTSVFSADDDDLPVLPRLKPKTKSARSNIGHFFRKRKPTLAKDQTEMDVPSRTEISNVKDSFTAHGDSHYATELINSSPSIENTNRLSFYRRHLSDDPTIMPVLPVRRLLPLGPTAFDPAAFTATVKMTLSENNLSSSFVVVDQAKAGPSRAFSIVSGERRDLAVPSMSTPVAERKITSISSIVIKLSTAPRFTKGQDGEVVRRPKINKSRSNRLYYIHDPTLPKIKEEDISDLVEEVEEVEESSESVTESVSIYSQESYVSLSGSPASEVELVENVVVEDLNESDIVEVTDEDEVEVEVDNNNNNNNNVQQQESVEDVDDVDDYYFENNYDDDSEDGDDEDDAFFADISAAMARSRARREGFCGKEQLFAREWSIPVMG